MQERYPVEFELLFVDDGSRDDTLSIIKSFASKDPKIKYLSFSRNFGKESAILAGLEHATGDYVALMDADLQDPPSLLTQMYETIKEGTYDCVGTKRVDRKGEPPIRSFFARCFYKLINKISKTSIVDGARDFRLMTRQMTDAILNMPEYNRFSAGSDLKRNGWNTRMLSAWQEARNGLFGACFYIHWTASSHSPRFHCP